MSEESFEMCSSDGPFSPLLQIKEYEKLNSEDERLTRSRQIYDMYIMKELLSCSHVGITRPSHPSWPYWSSPRAAIIPNDCCFMRRTVKTIAEGTVATDICSIGDVSLKSAGLGLAEFRVPYFILFYFKQ